MAEYRWKKKVRRPKGPPPREYVPGFVHIVPKHPVARGYLGPVQDFGSCINRSIICEACGAILGTQSTRKDL